MKLDRRFLVFLAVLSLAALACQTVMSSVQTKGSVDSTAAAPSVVLFEDDFSDTSSGWDDVEDVDGITGYRDGSYRILINKPDWYFWSTPGLNYSNVIIDVDATKIGGPDNNEFGIICRYKDPENFYIFSISSDGFFGITKFINGTQSGIGTNDLKFNDKVIRLGAATNHLRASCIGDSLTLEVNDQVLADFKDTDLSTGDIGLVASTYADPGTDIAFDNFVATRP